MQQTSLTAYFDEVKPKINHNQQIVLQGLRDIAPATNKMIAAHLDWPINSVTPRVLELRIKQQVRQAYVDKDSTGRKAIFWWAV